MKYRPRLSRPAGNLQARKFQIDGMDINPETITSTDKSEPRLPGELWRKIIGFTIRLAGANAIELEDPFSTPYINEEYPEVDPGLFADRKTISLVNSSWTAAVREIAAEYLVIYSGKQLAFLAQKFEADKPKLTDAAPVQLHKRLKNAKNAPHAGRGTTAYANSLKRLGEWTTRVDFKILGPYSIPLVLRLLRCLPNLRIYCNKNGPFDNPERPMPFEVIDGLITHNSHSLRRIEWAGAGEAPRYADLVHLCNCLSHLTTLRLVAIHSYPTVKTIAPPLLVLPRLKNLSLGVIPETQKHRAHYFITWDPLVRLLCQNPDIQIPSLKRLDCDIFPQHTMPFFYLHGHKLRFFRTTAWSVEEALADVLDNCPNLETLVISQGAEKVSIPWFHPTLRQICITPTTDVVVGVPQKVFDYAVMAPLDSLLKQIETMIAPCLVELRIRNMGAYLNLCEYSTWLRFWWIRWSIRGVQFLDKTGVSYQNIQDPNEALLNLVRC